MELEKQNILLFSRSTHHGGTENVIVQLCRILKPIVHNVCVCSSGGFRKDLLNELDIRHYEIADIESKNLKTIFSVLYKVIQIIRKEEITVIHTHHRMAALYTYLLSFKYNFNFLNTVHNTFYNKKKLTKFAYRRTNLIACGEMVKKNLVDYFQIKDSKITVIHNAVEPYDEEFVPIEIFQEWKSQGLCLIGNVGRLTEQKGMEFFLRGIPIVKKKCLNTKYIIIGDGEEKERLLLLSHELGVADDLYFLGYRDDIRNVMSQLDFIVLSSLWEGLPLTPIEAFSVGKPVVATAVDGTPEVVVDGKNGFLVEVRNVAQLAEKIFTMCNDKELRKKLGEQAYETYRTEFSFQILTVKYIKYYEEIEEKRLRQKR